MVPLLVFEGACHTSKPAAKDIPSSGPITIAIVGDTLLTRPVNTRDAGFAAVRDLLRGATVAFANLNGNILEDAPPAGTPEMPSSPFARPRDAAALRELGVDVVSLALLKGSEIDFVDELAGAEFRVRNPNAKSSCGCGHSHSF